MAMAMAASHEKDGAFQSSRADAPHATPRPLHHIPTSSPPPHGAAPPAPICPPPLPSPGPRVPPTLQLHNTSTCSASAPTTRSASVNELAVNAARPSGWKEGAPLSTSTAAAVPPAMSSTLPASGQEGRSRPAATHSSSVSAGVKALRIWMKLTDRYCGGKRGGRKGGAGEEQGKVGGAGVKGRGPVAGHGHAL